VVEEGQPAPDFTLESDTGEQVTLSQLRGKPVVLYFYQRDDTKAPFCSSALPAPGQQLPISWAPHC